MLFSYQDREFFVNELIEAASRVIPGYAPEQTRYRVTDEVDPRTLRYYIHQGLVDKPLGYKGKNGIYGYRHLLQLTAIKKLQAEYLPLRKIKEMIEGRDNPGLEELIVGLPEDRSPVPPPPPPAAKPGAPGKMKKRARDEQREMAKADDMDDALGEESDLLMDMDMAAGAGPSASEAESPPPPEPNQEAKDIGKGLLRAIFSRRRQAPPPEEGGEPDPTRWTRHELAPGLEVHVRDDFPVDTPKSKLEVLAVRLKRLLQRRKEGGSK